MLRIATNHDKAGRAKSTLASTHLSDAFLYWMWTIGIPNTLDGDHMFAINAHYRSKTCVHRGMIYLVGRRIML